MAVHGGKHGGAAAILMPIVNVNGKELSTIYIENC
jgi:hypothetical protein